MAEPETIISFYNKAIERNHHDFYTAIHNIAYDAERVDEEPRQQFIMGDMLLVFDKISMKKKKERYASEIFRGYDEDALTDFQLNVIKGCCHDHYPKVVESCTYIIENGC